MKTTRAKHDFGKRTFLFIRDGALAPYIPALRCGLESDGSSTGNPPSETGIPERTPRRSTLGSSAFSAFTLLELLVVIAIIGILAGIALPNLKSFKPNVMAAATSQLLSDVGRARQLAISQRTTVYMVFVPTNFWLNPGFTQQPPLEQAKGKTLYDKQWIGYTFVSLRRLGAQPGSIDPDYLSEWRTLPSGTFIVPDKFGPRVPANPRTVIDSEGEVIPFVGFPRSQNLPFPSPYATNWPAPYVSLPYIAFNYLGQLESGQDEYIPLALGSVSFSRNPATKEAQPGSPTVTENPPGNAINSFNLVHIDWLTGRAHAERMEIK